jgi:hypothetical protein
LSEDFGTATFADSFADLFDEGQKFRTLLSYKGLTQEISKSSHIATKSCIICSDRALAHEAILSGIES